jgi:hypothetical protein
MGRFKNVKKILDPKNIRVRAPKPKPKGSKGLEEVRKADKQLRRMKTLKQVANLAAGVGLYMYGPSGNEAKDKNKNTATSSSKKPQVKKNTKSLPKTKLASNKNFKSSN